MSTADITLGTPLEEVSPANGEKRRSFWESLRSQERIIEKIIVHDMRVRFKRRPFGVARLILSPCVHLALWWVIMTFMKIAHDRMGMEPILIISSGFLPFYYFRGPASLLRTSVMSSAAYMRYPGVSRFDIIMARFILEAAAATAVSILIFSLLISLGIAPFPRDWLGMFPPLAVLLCLGLGLGAFFAYLGPLAYVFRAFVISLAMRLLYFTAGIMYLGNSVAIPLQKFLCWNPMYNCVELFRIAYFSNFHNPNVNLWYPMAWALIFFLLALAMEHVIYRRNPDILRKKRQKEEKFEPYFSE